MTWKEKINQRAKALVESGACPPLHFPKQVGPTAVFCFEGRLWEIQFYIGLEDWGKVVEEVEGLEYAWFLAINGPVTELHNAVCSLLDLTPWEAWQLAKQEDIRYGIELFDGQGDWETQAKLEASRELLEEALFEAYCHSGDAGCHEDYYHFFDDLDEDDQWALMERLLAAWEGQ